MSPRAPRERHERHHPEERIDDRDPVGVVPLRAPGKEWSQTVGPLPVEVEATRDGRGDTRGDPAPGWVGPPPAARPEAQHQPNQPGAAQDLDCRTEDEVLDPPIYNQYRSSR